MEVTGILHAILPEESNATGSFKKKPIVIKTDEQYPQLISIEFVQDKIDLVDPYKIGESVKVHINLRGREWINPQGETKYFNTIQGWRIERVAGQFAPHESGSPTNQSPTNQPAPQFKEEDHDDLPF